MKKLLTLFSFLCVAIAMIAQTQVVVRKVYPRPTYGSVVAVPVVQQSEVRVVYPNTTQSQLNVVDFAGQQIPADIYDEYKKGRACAATGGVFTAIGVIAFVAGGLMYHTDMIGRQLTTVDKKIGIGLMSGGGACLVVGIPLCAYGNHAKKDFKLYYGKKIIH